MAISSTKIKLRPKTMRQDPWWIQPLIARLGLILFIVYATWAALQNSHYYYKPYLSPLYSPCLSDNCSYQSIPLVGSWWKLSPALLILPFPLGFRATCYYFRKAYYRSFFRLPSNCGVRDSSSKYSGETKFPLVLQNLHRYFFYLALPFAVVLSWDAISSFDFNGYFGIGLGSIILSIDSILIWLYMLSCNSCRHLCGGRTKKFSSSKVGYFSWKYLSKLNVYHMQFAWVSLGWVVVSDLYIRLVSSGVFSDPRIVFH